MIAGFHPFGGKIPTEDERYDVIAVQGHLSALMRFWNLSISNEVRVYGHMSVVVSGWVSQEGLLGGLTPNNGISVVASSVKPLN